MATALSFSLSRALLHTSAPRPSFHRRVSVSGAGATLPDARRLCRRSLAVSAAAGASPSDAGTTAWDGLGGVSVFAAGTGDAVPLRDLWDPSEGVVVVALLRHFGCFCCWELASDLKNSMPKFESVGAKLIAIGVGTSDKARILADGLPFPVDSLYADPERKAYDVLGLYHGLGRTLFSPASAKIYSRLDSIKEATKNYTLKGTPADLTGVMQQLPFPVDSLYADPERKAYDVLGLYHGLGRTLFSPASAKIYSRLDSIKEATKNYTLKGTPADLTGVMQQGGMFVFKGKELLYAWRDEGTGDHAPLDDVLGICRQVPVA